jgi:hypothetical protein
MQAKNVPRSVPWDAERLLLSCSVVAFAVTSEDQKWGCSWVACPHGQGVPFHTPHLLS